MVLIGVVLLRERGGEVVVGLEVEADWDAVALLATVKRGSSSGAWRRVSSEGTS